MERPTVHSEHVDVDRPVVDRLHGGSFGGSHHITADREFALQEFNDMPLLTRQPPQCRALSGSFAWYPADVGLGD